MGKKQKINLIIIAFFLVGGVFLYSYFPQIGLQKKEEAAGKSANQETPQDKLLADLLLDGNDHTLGNLERAQVVVIEYSDTECPWCKTFHYKFMSQIHSSYPDQIALVYRHFPLAIYPKSKKEAEALECAAEQGGNGIFWEYLERLYEITPSSNGLDPAELPRIAERLKLNTDEFSSCLEQSRYAEKVATQRFEGAKRGVRQTPSVIIWNKKNNQKTLISGANSRFPEVKALIENHLAE